MQIPSFGGTAERVDVTTFENGNRVYIPGVKDFGDALPFEFLFEPGASGNYATLKALEDDGEAHKFKVTFPDALSTSGEGTSFEFSGYPICEIEQSGVNDAIKFNCNITLNSSIEVTDAD